MRAASLLLASLPALALATAACTVSRAGPPTAPPTGVTLEVQVHHEGLAIFRSPTFRCGIDYCAGAVLYEVQETLRPEREQDGWSYTTAARPSGESVEIRFTYAPTILSLDRLVAVVKQGMEKNPDPRHPGPVRVRLLGAELNPGAAK